MTVKYHPRWKFRNEGAELELVCGDFRLRVWLPKGEANWSYVIETNPGNGERYEMVHMLTNQPNRDAAVQLCQDEFVRIIEDARVDWDWRLKP